MPGDLRARGADPKDCQQHQDGAKRDGLLHVGSPLESCECAQRTVLKIWLEMSGAFSTG
jgi:hypothetical protein